MIFNESVHVQKRIVEPAKAREKEREERLKDLEKTLSILAFNKGLEPDANGNVVMNFGGEERYGISQVIIRADKPFQIVSITERNSRNPTPRSDIQDYQIAKLKKLVENQLIELKISYYEEYVDNSNRELNDYNLDLFRDFLDYVEQYGLGQDSRIISLRRKYEELANQLLLQSIENTCSTITSKIESDPGMVPNLQFLLVDLKSKMQVAKDRGLAESEEVMHAQQLLEKYLERSET